MNESDWGLLAFLPLLVTLVLAFLTRSALLAMIVGVIMGTIMTGVEEHASLSGLFQASLGSGDFIWICQIVILIGILFELFRRSGVLTALAGRFSAGKTTRRRVEVSTWGMGFLIVDDYFSPLLTGTVMRPLSDRAGVPREKLAFLLDATTASVCILVPFTAWGAYLASLIAAQGGPVSSAEEGLAVFVHAIPYNAYPILMVLFTLGIAAGVLPDFGPMRRAEQRARTTGELIRPGATPLAGTDEVMSGEEPVGPEASLLLELLIPVILLVGFGAWTLIALGAVKIVEAFQLAVAYMLLVMAVRRRFVSLTAVADAITQGAKNVVGALLIVALAYALNAVTTGLGVGTVIVSMFADQISPSSLVPLTFLLAAIVSFATGTSWGTYALLTPVVLPLALEFSGAEVGPLLYQTVAAIAGGGIFGDHASPVSDTSVLSSVGAGSDHIDHVITQLPYALLVAAVTVGIYVVL